MNKLFADAFGSSIVYVIGTTMGNSNYYQREKVHTNRVSHKYGYRSIQEEGIMGIAMPKLSQLYIPRYERAKLIDSSSITFGRECVRLVNIAFQTSQMFPSMMGTCDTISQYLRKELTRQHPSEHFHIIIGENDTFSFAISDRGQFGEIKQEQYRVLIFSTQRIKLDTHDTNNQMKLQW